MTPALHFTRFGKFEIIRKLGRSMADVYLALDPDANRRVVLKIVEDCRDSYTQLIVEAERRGAQIQHQLHGLDARILEVYDYGDQDGCFFVAMQYAEGGNLAELLRDGRLDAMRAARYAAEICSQLQTLHAFQVDIDGQKRAVVHGDIKPSNIQIGPQEQVWLLDFGIAKAITATRNLTQHNLGSPAYCSPERLKNGQVDPAADLWAVGVCLYEMMAGLPPYQAQTTRKLENLIQSRRPPRALPEDCPAPVKAIIAKALSGDIERRYPDARAFEADLRSFLDRKPATAEAERAPSWDSNATVEKQKPEPEPIFKPSHRARLNRFLADFNVVAWSLIAGLIVGLLCFIPAMEWYRYRQESAPLRAGRDYARAPVPLVESDWRLYRHLQARYATLAGFPLAGALTRPMLIAMVAAADDVFDAWRNSADPGLSGYDWNKAQSCIRHALEIQPSSSELQGKLALAQGLAALGSDPPSYDEAQKQLQTAVGDLPKSPDPHLGLARVYVYGQANVGRAMAEFQAAERLGYKLGPREFETQGDGYLRRAEQEFRQWQRSVTPAEQRRLAAAMQRDFERARTLYEPIAGFSNSSVSLTRLDQDESSAERIQTARERALKLAARRRPRVVRRWR